MKTIIDREVEKLKRVKKPPICLSTFVIYLYRLKGLLTPREIVEYNKLKSLQRYAEAEPVVSNDDDDVMEISSTPKKGRPNPEVAQPSGTRRSSTPAKRKLSTESLKPIGPLEHTGDLCVDLTNLPGQMTQYVQYLLEITKHEHQLAQEAIAITGTARIEECIAHLHSFWDMADQQESQEAELTRNREKVIKLQQELHDARLDFREARDGALQPSRAWCRSKKL